MEQAKKHTFYIEIINVYQVARIGIEHEKFVTVTVSLP